MVGGWVCVFVVGLRGPALLCDPEGGHSLAAVTLAWRMRAACFLVCSSGPHPSPPALEPRALSVCVLPPCVCACMKAPSSALPSRLLQEWEQRLPGLQSTTHSWWTRPFCQYLIWSDLAGPLAARCALCRALGTRRWAFPTAGFLPLGCYCLLVGGLVCVFRGWLAWASSAMRP